MIYLEQRKSVFQYFVFHQRRILTNQPRLNPTNQKPEVSPKIPKLPQQRTAMVCPHPVKRAKRTKHQIVKIQEFQNGSKFRNIYGLPREHSTFLIKREFVIFDNRSKSTFKSGIHEPVWRARTRNSQAGSDQNISTRTKRCVDPCSK